MSKVKAVFDVAPLLENNWTGISNVIGAIAEKAIADDRIDWTFCYEILPLPRSLIEKLLGDQSGAHSGGLFHDAAINGRSLDFLQAREYVAVFPHVKPVRRYFRKEALVVHDLSPLLTPSYHNQDNIDHFANRIRHDIESSDHYFCVSEATRGDVELYFQCPRDKTSVIRLGTSFDPCDLSLALDGARRGITVEPYVVVLGTLEPRKNAAIVLEFLLENPQFGRDYKFIFIGRDGWLDEKGRLLRLLVENGIPTEQVVFTGFVPPEQRAILLANCAFCIYPSFFEGFGLPILEAATLNKFTVCSNASSMPEVAPDRSIFFDPNSLDEFSEAMYIAHRCALIGRLSRTSLADTLRRGREASWDQCYGEIARWVLETA